MQGIQPDAIQARPSVATRLFGDRHLEASNNIEKETVKRVLRARAESIIVEAQMGEVGRLCEKAAFQDALAHNWAITLAGNNHVLLSELNHYYMVGKMAKGQLIGSMTDRFCR